MTAEEARKISSSVYTKQCSDALAANPNALTEILAAVSTAANAGLSQTTWQGLKYDAITRAALIILLVGDSYKFRVAAYEVTKLIVSW